MLSIIWSKTFRRKYYRSKKKWVYYSNGNTIDGYKKASIRINDGADINSFYLLSFENQAALLKLENSMGEGENDRDD